MDKFNLSESEIEKYWLKSYYIMIKKPLFTNARDYMENEIFIKLQV